MDSLIEIILKGKGSKISSDFAEPIIIPSEQFIAQIGVRNFATFNNIPNIVKGKKIKLKSRYPVSKVGTCFPWKREPTSSKLLESKLKNG